MSSCDRCGLIYAPPSQLKAENKKLKTMLKSCAETFDILDENTHPQLEFDALASECRALLDVQKQEDLK